MLYEPLAVDMLVCRVALIAPTTPPTTPPVSKIRDPVST